MPCRDVEGNCRLAWSSTKNVAMERQSCHMEPDAFSHVPALRVPSLYVPLCPPPPLGGNGALVVPLSPGRPGTDR